MAKSPPPHPPRRTAGLDVGERRIGIAVSDPLGITAQPVGVIERRSTQAAVTAILETLADYDVGSFVAGLPLNMDGSHGSQAERVREFCARLEAASAIPVIFQDERLTSVQGERVLIEAGLRRSARKRKLDATASVLILQSHLDARSRQP